MLGAPNVGQAASLPVGRARAGRLAACPTFGLLVLAGILTLFPPLSTLADGKVFPPRAVPVEVRIPDQRALLWWTSGVERLVIETRFTGQGTNFAWIVPLPAPPKVEAATRGLFPTLTQLMQPEVIHRPIPIFAAVLFATGLGWLLLMLKADKAIRWTDWSACLAVGGGIVLIARNEGGTGLFGLICFLAIIWATVRVRQGREPRWAVALVLVLPIILAGMLLPALSKAGGSAGSAVTVLDRQLAGVFETTTITGRDPVALRGWLETNGYVMPKEVEPVIADYLRDGWVFVASKVRRDSGAADTNSLHPLSFTFAAKEPVYPLRLTGVGNGPLEVDLFVFGPERAKVDGFKVLECRPVQYPPTKPTAAERWRPDPGVLPMAHPGLREAAPTAMLVTRLSGKLSPEQMRQDTVIRWDGFAGARDVRYSTRGALMTALNWSGSAFCVFVLGVAIVSRVRGVEPATCARATMFAAGVAAVITGIIYLSLPVVSVKLEKGYRRFDAMNQFRAVRLALVDELPTNAPVTVESVRAAIRRGLPAQFSETARAKLGYEIREEDSPYNYSLRAVPGGVEVLFHDAWGRPEVVRVPE
jgi:hypothetical protein